MTLRVYRLTRCVVRSIGPFSLKNSLSLSLLLAAVGVTAAPGTRGLAEPAYRLVCGTDSLSGAREVLRALIQEFTLLAMWASFQDTLLNLRSTVLLHLGKRRYWWSFITVSAVVLAFAYWCGLVFVVLAASLLVERPVIGVGETSAALVMRSLGGSSLLLWQAALSQTLRESRLPLFLMMLQTAIAVAACWRPAAWPWLPSSYGMWCRVRDLQAPPLFTSSAAVIGIALVLIAIGWGAGRACVRFYD